MKTRLWILSLIFAAPFAQSQSTVVSIDPVNEPNLQIRRPHETLSHPLGGVVSLFEAHLNGQPVYVLRRVDEQGNRLWTHTISRFSAGLLWYLGRSKVTQTGSTVFALGSTDQWTDTRLVSLDADGQLEWDVGLASTVGGAHVGVAGIDSTPNGDVLIGGLIDNFFIPPFDGRALVRRIDGTNGALVWAYETPSISFAQAAFLDGKTYLVHYAPTGVTAECVDEHGSVLYATTAPFPFTSQPGPAFIAVSPTGKLAVGHDEGFPSPPGVEIVTLDPAGSLLWTIRQPASWPLKDAVFTDTEDLVVIEASSSGMLATRLDGSGNLVWQHAAPAGTRRYAQVERSSGDGVVILGFDNSAVYPNADAKLEFVDAAGVTTGQELFEHSSATYGYAGSLARDARGNFWVGLARFEGGLDPTSGEVVKVVPGGDPSAALCTQPTPNSTGAPGRMRTAGYGVAAEDNLTLVVDRLPAQQFVLFLNSRTPGFLPNPGGSLGDLCLGGSIGRYAGAGEIRRTSPVGLASLQLDLPDTPNGISTVSIVAGETWHFQAWHRDVVGGVPTSHLTGAVSVMFL